MQIEENQAHTRHTQTPFYVFQRLYNYNVWYIPLNLNFCAYKPYVGRVCVVARLVGRSELLRAHVELRAHVRSRFGHLEIFGLAEIAQFYRVSFVQQQIP